MSELIQEFEKTTTFKYFYSTLLKFDESLNCYVATEEWRNKEAELLTAAWWMFQEQYTATNDLKAQLNNMEACYIEKKKQVEVCAALVGEWREKPMGGWSDYARGELHSRQDCVDDLEKALRGVNDINLTR